MDLLGQYYPILKQKVYELFSKDSSGHDYYHVLRVYNLALKIQETEGGDRTVIGVSALLHDLHRLIKRQDKKYAMPIESIPMVNEILISIDFPANLISPVLHAIEVHEDYSFALQNRTAGSIEALILQDADRLDGIGAIGVGRCFAFCGAHSLPMYNPEIPIADTKFDATIGDPSAIHHFFNKLLKTSTNMNTKTATVMAQHRHKFIKKFADTFLNEWNGIL